jgi:hypothetical protein
VPCEIWTQRPGEASQIGPDTDSLSADEISESLTQQGAKSDRREFRRLLSLLALSHSRDLAALSAYEIMKPILVKAQRH